tara:strand:- start:668 stop:2548 length:1881 start_codon:yes stop_codon:yes gene_type:complete
MEAVILVGLIGAGLMINKDKSTPIEKNVNKEVNFPSMDNTYESIYHDKTQDEIRKLAEKRFNDSQQPGNTVNFQKTKENHGLEIPLNDLIDKQDNIEGFKNYAKYTFSNSAGGFISNEDFLTNDQGIKVAPFFSSQSPNVNFDDSRQLERTQGRIEGSRSKREVSGNAFFDLVRDSGNVFGNTFDSHRADQTRYDNGSIRNNELPFVQERIAPIDSMSNFNREIGQTIANRRNIDNLRTVNDPKLTYEGRVLPGKGFDQRGKEGEVFKYNPETYYENNPNKWFVTNGAFLAKSERPEQILPDTNRKYFNKGEFGPAAPAVQENGELRGKYKRTLRQQLGSDTMRNAGSEVPILNNNMNQQGYKALPNERQVTELRTYDSNLKTDVASQMVGLQDKAKNTKKQTTIDSANNGYLGNNVDASTKRQYDSVRVTKKQTTIDSANNGYLGNNIGALTTKPYEAPEWTTKDSTQFEYTGNAGAIAGINGQTTKPYDAPDWTVKDSTHFSYGGNAGASVIGDMSKTNYMNAETNPTKEIISQGRAPTLNNTKVANGMDTINMDIKKMDVDYMNHRLNGVDKVYGVIPQDNTCEITSMKDRLEDNSIANRIDPNLLNPFKQNPYTQPLNSFTY